MCVGGIVLLIVSGHTPEVEILMYLCLNWVVQYRVLHCHLCVGGVH